MSISTLKKLLLGKIESTPDTDAVPTPGSDAIRIISAKWSPMVDAIKREGVRQTANELSIGMNAKGQQLEVEGYIRGSGSLGVSPDWAPIAYCAEHAITNNAGVSVVFDPITTGPDAARQTSTFYYYEDGVLYKLVGALCSAFSIEFPVGEYMRFKATIVAPWVAPQDMALPGGITYQTSSPVKVSSTDVITDNAVAAEVGSYSFERGGSGEVKQYIGALLTVPGASQRPVVKMTKRSIATSADYTRLLALTEAALYSQFGSAGNRVTFNAPKAQFESVTPVEDGILNNREISFKLNDNTGDDAYSITLD